MLLLSPELRTTPLASANTTMYSITKRLPKLAGLAIIALSAACSSDRVASPIAETSNPAMNVLAPASPSAVMQSAAVAPQVETPAPSSGRFHAMAAVYPSNAVSFQFTVNPTVAQSFIVGTHMVNFPAYTICNPNNSGYGASTWLTSCTKLTTSITITATTWTDANGRAQIDFANAIRFYPNNSSQLPAIYLRDATASMSSYGRVDYCASIDSCVNEAATDTTLATQRDAATGFLFRLVRHFSGYNVWA